MSKAAHTPTPWDITLWSRDPEDYLIINGNKVVAKGFDLVDAEFVKQCANHHHELVTRLYNLVNSIESAMEDYQIPIQIKFCRNEARETLKKVIQ